MSGPIITIEQLGKKYVLTHQGESQRYTALRDVITDGVKRLVRRSSRKEQHGFARTEEFWALKDVTFDIKQGEVVGIIGRNGAGKSTLLKILSRITEPTTGRVRLNGRVASLLEVGTGFHPELSGRENIYLNGAILGMTRVEIKNKFDEIVAFAEVERFIDTPVKRYSSGMYVRLAFAIAAHIEPDILVVDEVLAVGDADFQNKCLGKMQDVSRGGRAVLFVSHNMSAVQTLCGTGVLLDRGQLSAVGPMDEVIAKYLTAIRSNGLPSHTSEVTLGPHLKVGNLGFYPAVVESGSPTTLHLRLIPITSISIRELAVLIFSDIGVRIAILDLRRAGLASIALRNTPFDFTVAIASLPLVEGTYRLGLYVATNDYNVDCPDIVSFSVDAVKNKGLFTSYSPPHRGLVELVFSMTCAEVPTSEGVNQ